MVKFINRILFNLFTISLLFLRVTGQTIFDLSSDQSPGKNYHILGYDSDLSYYNELTQHKTTEGATQVSLDDHVLEVPIYFMMPDPLINSDPNYPPVTVIAEDSVPGYSLVKLGQNEKYEVKNTNNDLASTLHYHKDTPVHSEHPSTLLYHQNTPVASEVPSPFDYHKEAPVSSDHQSTFHYHKDKPAVSEFQNTFHYDKETPGSVSSDLSNTFHYENDKLSISEQNPGLYNPFGIVEESRKHARQGPFSPGHSHTFEQSYHNENRHGIFPDMHTLHELFQQGRPISLDSVSSAEPHQMYGATLQTNTGSNVYLNPQSSNQIQIYPPTASNTHHIPVSSSATSLSSSYSSPTLINKFITRSHKDQNQKTQFYSPQPSSIPSFQQPNALSSLSSPTVQVSPPKPLHNLRSFFHPPKPKHNVHQLLGALLGILKHHVPARPPILPPPPPIRMPLLGLPMPRRPRRRRPVLSNFYRKMSPYRSSFRRSKKRRGRTPMYKRIARLYGRETHEQEEEDDEENVSVLGEDVYDGDNDVFDLEMNDEGDDYSVLEDASVYEQNYVDDY